MMVLLAAGKPEILMPTMVTDEKENPLELDTETKMEYLGSCLIVGAATKLFDLASMVFGPLLETSSSLFFYTKRNSSESLEVLVFSKCQVLFS